MRKVPGIYIVEFYDEYHSKVKTKKAKNYQDAAKKANKWKKKKAGYSASAELVVYNTEYEGMKYV